MPERLPSWKDTNGSWKPAPSWKGIPDVVSWKWDAGPSAVQRSLTLFVCFRLAPSPPGLPGIRQVQRDLKRAAITTGAPYTLDLFGVLSAELERM
jgi:hypothetical protein